MKKIEKEIILMDYENSVNQYKRKTNSSFKYMNETHKETKMTDISRNSKLFEEIKHYNEFDMEFWYARELQEVLEYSKWDNFKKVINKA